MRTLLIPAEEEEEERKQPALRLIPAEEKEPEETSKGQIAYRAAASFPKAAIGAVETAGSVATGALVGFPLSGLAMLGSLVSTGDTEKAIQAGAKASDFVTYKPQSEYGQIYTEMVGKLIEIPRKIATTYGEATVTRDELDEIYNDMGLPTGTLSPGMATAVTTPLELFLYGAAFRPLHGAVEGRARARNFMKNATAEDWAKAEGLIKADKPEALKSYLIKREAEVGYKAPPPPRIRIRKEGKAPDFTQNSRRFSANKLSEHMAEKTVVRAEGVGGRAAEGVQNLELINRENYVYRGMTEAEYKNTVAQRKGVQSRKDYSFGEEGTSFAEKPADAESFVNYGRDDPRTTGKPTYLIEVEKGENVKLNRQGYYYAEHIPQEQISRTWKMEGKGSEIVASLIDQNPRSMTLDFLGMQSMYERARSLEMKRGISRFAEKFKEFWVPFSTVPEGGKALGFRYKAMGDIARSERFIEGIHKKLDAYPDDVKADFFRYMDGQLELDMLPPEAQRLAQSLRGASDRIGQMLVKRGILKKEQYDAHKGKYVHYMYAKHIVGDDVPVGVAPTGKLNLSYAKSRKDLTLEQRKALGLIEDASVAVPVGMGKALADAAKHDYLQALGENPEWTWQPSMVDVGQGQRIGIGKLVEEVKTYEKMMEVAPSQEVQARHAQLRDSLDRAMQETQNVPRDFTQLPNTKTYGPLAGAYVRKPIAADLKPIMGAFVDKGALFQTLVDIESQGVALFKMGKVALNVPTATRNVITNLLQMNMRGRPLYEVPGDVIDGATSMLKKDVYYEEAFRQGMFKTNWSAVEIGEILNTFSRVKTGNWASFINAAKKAAKYYGRIDDIAKLSIYRQMREAGSDITTSTLEAMKWGMDYSLASRSVKGLRQHIVPFISYQYKIAPLIAESLAKRPWVIGKYAAIPALAIAAVKEMHDMTDKDWKKLEKQLPHYIKRSGTYAVMPLKSPEGNWQWVNLEYFFPWGNYHQLFRDMSQSEMGEVARDLGISNPFMDIFRMAASAKEDKPPVHPFYGTPIYNRLDPAPIKAAKTMEFVAYTWFPPMLSRRGALGYTEGAVSGEKDKWGRSITPAQAVGRWFGVNIVAVSPKQTAIIKKAKARELRREFFRIKSDPTKSKVEKRRAAQRLKSAMRELREQ